MPDMTEMPIELPPPTRPILIKCNGEDGNCNRWVWTHSETPMGFIFQGRIYCAHHVPIHE